MTVRSASIGPLALVLALVGVGARREAATAPPDRGPHVPVALSGWIALPDASAASPAAPAAGGAGAPRGAAPRLPRATTGPTSAPTIVVEDEVLSTGARGGHARTSAEPTIGVLDDASAVVVGNGFGALRGPAGWVPLDPYAWFPLPGDTFVADPVAIADPRGRVVVVYAQFHSPAGEGKQFNGAVLVVATPAELRDQRARYYRLDPALFGLEGRWFDYPDLAFTDGYLHAIVGVPERDASAPDGRRLWMRVPVAELATDAGAVLHAEHVSIVAPRANLRLTQGAATAMYAAGHADVGTALALHRWRDEVDPATGAPRDVEVLPPLAVDAWRPAEASWTSRCPRPVGSDWLARLNAFASGDVTAAWCRPGPTLAQDEVGFAWSAPVDGGHPQPYVRAVIGRPDGSVRAQPVLADPDVAYAYPAAVPAADGRVAVAACFGGGGHAPGIVVGFLGDGAQPWDLAFPVEGDAAPASGAWGDYLGVRAIPGSSPQRFAATGWVLRGGDGDAAVEVHVLRFGAADRK